MKTLRASNDRRRRVATIAMAEPIRAVRATLIQRGDQMVGIRCGGKTLMAPHPVYALCAKLKAAGRPDGSLRVENQDHTGAVFVLSIHALAAWPQEDLAKHWATT